MSNNYLKFLLAGFAILVSVLLLQKYEAREKTQDCVTVWKTQGEAAGEKCFTEHPDSTEVTED